MKLVEAVRLPDEELRLEVAKLCGWQWKRDDDTGSYCWYSPDGQFWDRALFREDRNKEDFIHCLPDYPRDLNAMYGAEKEISDEYTARRYEELLYLVWDTSADEGTHADRIKQHVSARHRAEVFVAAMSGDETRVFQRGEDGLLK